MKQNISSTVSTTSKSIHGESNTEGAATNNASKELKGLKIRPLNSVVKNKKKKKIRNVNHVRLRQGGSPLLY